MAVIDLCNYDRGGGAGYQFSGTNLAMKISTVAASITSSVLAPFNPKKTALFLGVVKSSNNTSLMWQLADSVMPLVWSSVT
jgi:hypothetical protein